MTALRAYRSPSADDLVTAHLPLVRRLAWHVHGRMSSALELEDLMQIGLVALIEAARDYEDRGFAFATYAGTRVKGAMIDALRRGSRQTRAAAADRRRIDGAKRVLEVRLGRPPTPPEIAVELGLPLLAFVELELASTPTSETSLDAAYSDGDARFADDLPAIEDLLDDEAVRGRLAAAIATLPTREQQVMQLYFVEELNLAEIGAVLAVSQSRVCQIKSGALARLRRALA